MQTFFLKLNTKLAYHFTKSKGEQAMKKQAGVKVICWLGFDLSTTALSCGARTKDGEEFFASVPIQGAILWYEQPAFCSEWVPNMIAQILEKFKEQGCVFGAEGALSFSVRQHDLAVAEANTRILRPLLSWQCNAATAEVKELQEMGAEKIVGKIEPRFILPKLMWILKEDPQMRAFIQFVMTTGDWICAMLTGNYRLSASDALSNGLLNQETKKLAVDVITKAGLNPEWFPEVISSNSVVGRVQPPRSDTDPWAFIKTTLTDWSVAASLGDNHASAVGCGLSDDQTIIVSVGTSGTVVRMCSPKAKLETGKPACFEYYDNRLLLLMLAHCCAWYDKFVERWGEEKKHDELNKMAMKTRFEDWRYIKTNDDGLEIYPDDWSQIPLDIKVASVQSSIVAHLIKLVEIMLKEVKEAEPITKVVLTGGLSQSEFFCYTFKNILFYLNPQIKLFVSDRQGPLASKAAAAGALANAIFGIGINSLQAIITELCPLKPLD
ncbi:MAG: FGGY family carbohydrate kinase [Patescibacteria group bacterium]